MSDNDFMRRRQDAVERMREMSRKAAESSAQPMPPMPPFVRLQNRENQAQSQGSAASQQSVQTGSQASPASNENYLPHTRKGGLSSLPFLDMLNIDGDLPLIIGLLLILFSEKADKKLLFALIYILL
jgi:hypothetical protein